MIKSLKRFEAEHEALMAEYRKQICSMKGCKNKASYHAVDNQYNRIPFCQNHYIGTTHVTFEEYENAHAWSRDARYLKKVKNEISV